MLLCCLVRLLVLGPTTEEEKEEKEKRTKEKKTAFPERAIDRDRPTFVGGRTNERTGGARSVGPPPEARKKGRQG